MKKLFRIKQILSVALVSVLAATVMPSTASADPEYINYDDVVTVEVDLGGGPGEEVGCEGVATLELPDNTLRARLDSRQPGITNPDIIDYLLWAWGSNDQILPFGDLGPEPTEFTDDDLDDFYNWLSYSAEISPVLYVGDTPNPDATVSNLTSISYDSSSNFYYLDTNLNGSIDAADAPDFLTETKRVYSSDVFEVSYEATDCVDSSDIGVLYATRGYVQRLLVDESDPNVSSWADAEADWDEYTSSVNRGQAYLRGNLSALGGFISIPAKVAMYPEVTDEPIGEVYDIYDWDPISLGGAGSVEMRAVMKIFGASPTGKYRTQFYYQLITGEENFLTCEILDYCG